MPRLVLHDVHEAAGAIFSSLGDVEIPQNYGNPESEYCSVKEGVGIIERSARGKLNITGADRARFLQGMVTNRVEGLKFGEGNYAALTDAQGHTLTDLWVNNRGDSFLLETEPGYQEKLYHSLDRFLIADDVKIEDVTTSWVVLGIQGQDSKYLAEVVLDGLQKDLSEHHTAICKYNGVDVAVTSRTFTGELGYDFWVDPEGAKALWTSLVKAGGKPVGFEALEVLRVEAGMPRYGVDVDRRMMPLEARLIHVVDFNKGCYIGQEAIAKMHYRGKPRRYLIGLQIHNQTIPEMGTSVLVDGKSVGWVTSSVWSWSLDCVVALASIRRGFHQQGKIVTIEGNEDIQAEIVSLPFYDSE